MKQMLSLLLSAHFLSLSPHLSDPACLHVNPIMRGVDVAAVVVAIVVVFVAAKGQKFLMEGGKRKGCCYA